MIEHTSIIVTHQTPLKQWVRNKRHPVYNIGWGEGDRLWLSEEIGWIAIQSHLAELRGRVKLKGYDGRRVDQIDTFPRECPIIGEQLNLPASQRPRCTAITLGVILRIPIQGIFQPQCCCKARLFGSR